NFYFYVYNLKDFTNSLTLTCTSSADENNRFFSIKNIQDNLNVNKTISKNPLIQIISPPPIENITFPYVNAYSQGGVYASIVSTTSVLYGYGINATETNLLN